MLKRTKRFLPLCVAACSQSPTQPNQPPETRVLEYQLNHQSATITYEGQDTDGTIQSFETKLDDAGWSATKLTQVTYQNLTLAPHTVYVRAIDNDGALDPTPATQSILVEPTLEEIQTGVTNRTGVTIFTDDDQEKVEVTVKNPQGQPLNDIEVTFHNGSPLEKYEVFIARDRSNQYATTVHAALHNSPQEITMEPLGDSGYNQVTHEGDSLESLLNFWEVGTLNVECTDENLTYRGTITGSEFYNYHSGMLEVMYFLLSNALSIDLKSIVTTLLNPLDKLLRETGLGQILDYSEEEILANNWDIYSITYEKKYGSAIVENRETVFIPSNRPVVDTFSVQAQANTVTSTFSAHDPTEYPFTDISDKTQECLGSGLEYRVSVSGPTTKVVEGESPLTINDLSPGDYTAVLSVTDATQINTTQATTTFSVQGAGLEIISVLPTPPYTSGWFTGVYSKDSHLWILDNRFSLLIKLDPLINSTQNYSIAVEAPSAIAYKDTFYIGEAHHNTPEEVVKLGTNRSYSILDDQDYPAGLVYHDGNFWCFYDGNRLKKLDSNMTPLQEFTIPFSESRSTGGDLTIKEGAFWYCGSDLRQGRIGELEVSNVDVRVLREYVFPEVKSFDGITWDGSNFWTVSQYRINKHAPD